ncbi:hypothetical protein N7519_001212 [Penicillium mononematosum]|uniref:uncharacterized protein n=1 Tax=Penicillium mononematosum TaxID=268346 RepID=UPI0025497DDA|nr:uncharacterized protein N7519_001212 [Penicillium mononematosum]KAJ6191191.1 hypothetical protein N7519_001212 [Penicillium mononematosum]
MFPPAPTGESSSHSGNCHCGAVRFSFTLSPPLHEYPTNTCNCSICTKNGYLLVYPFTKDFTIEKGEDVLKDYRFGNRTEPFEGVQPITAVNVRLLQDFDVEKLILNKVDGRSFPPEYKV